jgi:O-antigen/teichoic acid export membrane protein
MRSSDTTKPSPFWSAVVGSRVLFAGSLARKILTSIGAVFVGGAASSALGFLSTVIISKGLGPSGFGLTSTAIAYFYLVFGCVEFGLSASVVRFGALTEQGNVQRLAAILKAGLVLRTMTGILVVIVGVGAAAPLARVIYRDAAHTPLILWASFSAALYLLGSFIDMSLRLYERFFVLALYTLAPNLIRLIITYLLYRSGHLDPVTATVAISLGLAAGIILGIPWLPLSLLRESARLPIRAVARELLGFGKWVFLTNVGVSLISRVDTLILSHYADSSQVGLYAAGFQLTMIFQILQTSLGTVLLPQVTRLKGRIQTWRFIRILLGLAVAISSVMLALIPFAGTLVPLVFGSRFAGATPIFQILLVNYALQLYSLPFATLILARGRSQLLAYQTALQLVLGLVCNSQLIPRYGAIGGAVTLLFLAVVGGVWSIVAGYRLIPTDDETRQAEAPVT